MRCPVLHLPDGPRRFCQKCNRLHALDRFEEEKRVCRTQLDTFNARRRAQYAQRKSEHAAATLAKRVASRQRKSGKGADEADQEPGRLGSSSSSANAECGMLSDADIVQLGATVADLFEDDDMLGFSAFPPRCAPILLSGASLPVLAGSGTAGAASEPAGPQADAMASSSDGADAEAAFWWWPLPETTARCADLKLDGDVAPFSLPASLPDALCGSLVEPQESLLDFVGAIEPGCVLLTCEALVAGGTSRPASVDATLRRLVQDADPAVARFLRSTCSAVTLSGPSLAGTARLGRGGEVTVTHRGKDAPAMDGSLVVLAFPRAQLATVAVTVAVTLRAPDSAAALAAWAQHGVRARMHGHWLACSVDGFSPDGTALLVTLQPPCREGVVMLEPATPAAGSTSQHAPRGPPAAVVMTSSPQLAAELNAPSAAEPARLHHALLVLGHALQEAGSGHTVQAHAACASLRMGWLYAAGACINALSAATAELSAAPEALLPNMSIMHEAVAIGRMQAVEALMAAVAECCARVGPDLADALFGNPGQSRGMMSGYTPLHVCALAPAGRAAAARGSAEAARLLMGLPADWEAADDPHSGQADAASADAAVAWASVRDDAGRTASQAAGARHVTDPLARLDARIRAQLERARTLALLACGAAQQEDGALALPDTIACAQLRLDAVAEAMAHLTARPVTPRTVALASALLRDAAHAVASMPAPVGILGRWASRLSLRRAPRAPAAQDAVVVPISEDAWRLARTSLTVHWYLAFMVLYNFGTALRIPRGTVLSLEQLRRPDLFTPAPHWPHTGQSPAVEYTVGGWKGISKAGIVDFTAIQALTLEFSTTLLLGSVLLVPRLRAWLTACPRLAGRVSTWRLQAVVFYQLLVHGMLTSSLMSRRTGALLMATRGTIVAWPLHSSIVMLFFSPSIYFCMPAKRAVALPLIAIRVVLVIGAWAAPTTFYALWPVSATAGTLVQLVALAVAAAMVLQRERRLTAEYAALLAAARAPKAKSA